MKTLMKVMLITMLFATSSSALANEQTSGDIYVHTIVGLGMDN